jgi:hypothetical protein
MTLTLTKTHKILVTIGLAMGLGANVGTYFLLPERITKLEIAHLKDHDVLIEVKTKIEILNQRLVLTKNENYNNFVSITNVPLYQSYVPRM